MLPVAVASSPAVSPYSPGGLRSSPPLSTSPPVYFPSPPMSLSPLASHTLHAALSNSPTSWLAAPGQPPMQIGHGIGQHGVPVMLPVMGPPGGPQHFYGVPMGQPQMGPPQMGPPTNGMGGFAGNYSPDGIHLSCSPPDRASPSSLLPPGAGGGSAGGYGGPAAPMGRLGNGSCGQCGQWGPGVVDERDSRLYCHRCWQEYHGAFAAAGGAAPPGSPSRSPGGSANGQSFHGGGMYAGVPPGATGAPIYAHHAAGPHGCAQYGFASGPGAGQPAPPTWFPVNTGGTAGGAGSTAAGGERGGGGNGGGGGGGGGAGPSALKVSRLHLVDLAGSGLRTEGGREGHRSRMGC